MPWTSSARRSPTRTALSQARRQSARSRSGTSSRASSWSTSARMSAREDGRRGYGASAGRRSGRPAPSPGPASGRRPTGGRRAPDCTWRASGDPMSGRTTRGRRVRVALRARDARLVTGALGQQRHLPGVGGEARRVPAGLGHWRGLTRQLRMADARAAPGTAAERECSSSGVSSPTG
jgi:hypothetical protein